MAGGRRYSGLAAEERTRQRREAILAAALHRFGTHGYAATPVKQICREARLTERYFYESFRDREDALSALYTDLAEATYAATLAAVEDAGEDIDTQIAAGLGAFVHHLTDDHRRAQVILVEVVGVSPALEQRRLGVLHRFAELVAAVWQRSTGSPDTRQWLSAVALVGAVNHLLVDWLTGDQQHSPDTLIDVCVTLFTAAHTQLGATPPPPSPAERTQPQQ
jgi:AcrR family transcriptional regulator